MRVGDVGRGRSVSLAVDCECFTVGRLGVRQIAKVTVNVGKVAYGMGERAGVVTLGAQQGDGFFTKRQCVIVCVIVAFDVGQGQRSAGDVGCDIVRAAAGKQVFRQAARRVRLACPAGCKDVGNRLIDTDRFASA